MQAIAIDRLHDRSLNRADKLKNFNLIYNINKAVQTFFSMSACCGGLIVMASFNQFKNNILRY